LPHIPALDGLRGLATLGVLFYHAGTRWMPGGFLGVDVFFVLSGYLITASLWHEWNCRQEVDLRGFWQRRIQRVYPAMVVLIAVTLAFAALWLPDQGKTLRGDALAAAGYVSNWHLILTQRPYFETMGRPPLLQHLWSLAVEVQFYLLWAPLFLLIIRRGSRKRGWIVALIGAALSLAWMAMLYHPDRDPSRVYYGTDTRLAALLLGAALACIWSPERRHELAPRAPGWAIDGVGLGTLGVLVGAWIYVHEFRPLLYRGGFGIVAMVAAIAIGAAIHPRSRLLAGLLGSAPLRWLGKRSYSIYLWHWPVFAVTRPRLDVTLDGVPLLLLRLGITIILAEGSFRLVERPLRYSRAGWATRGFVRGASLATVLAACVTLVSAATAQVAAAAVIDSSFAHAPTSPLSVSMPRETPVVHSAFQDQDARTPTPSATLPPAGRKEHAVFLFSDTPIRTTTTAATLPKRTEKRVRAARSVPVHSTAQPTAAKATEQVPTRVPRLHTRAQMAALPATPSDRRPAPTAVVAIDPTPAATPTATLPSTMSPPTQPYVLALGDSVMVGAGRALVEAISDIEVDAKVGRQAPEMIQLVRERRQSGQLGDIVVIHLGSNGIFYPEQFDQMVDLLSDVPKVVFVNVQVPRRWQDPINDMLRERTQRHANVVLADWYATSVDCTDCFVEDGVHLRPNGAALYAEFIVASLELPLQDAAYGSLQ
jgi:peptidoglycan/LPS O-acetylase OafA/YrhL